MRLIEGGQVGEPERMGVSASDFMVGTCPAIRECRSELQLPLSIKGNRHMRRILNQTSNPTVKAKGSIFEIVYRRTVTASRASTNLRGDCPSAVSSHLENSAPGSSLPGTRPSCQQKIEAKTCCEYDPGTPKPRLSGRVREFSTAQSSMRARISTLARQGFGSFI